MPPEPFDQAIRLEAPEELRTEAVHDRLRESILMGEFDPDVPISQVQLAKRLGVSRTPLREALRMLQREGLIDSEPNRRVRVAALSLADLEQLYATRLVVEALAIQLSVPLFTERDFAAMRASLDEMDGLAAKRDATRWERPHQRYHGLLRTHAGARLQRMAAELSDHGLRYRRVYLAEPGAWSSAAEDHMGIFEACNAGNATLASDRLTRHLARTALTVIASVAPEHDPAPVRMALRLITRQRSDGGDIAA
jgi:GntR family transcriptional regulator, rspAB operon transcriptional repressor